MASICSHDSLTLPGALPIFPLSGALLLPRGHLPLHVFEPRYRNMVAAALRGDRLIGMVQLRDPPEGLSSDTADVYDIGCAGRIVSFTETDDGRYYLTLRGFCRFRINTELPLVEGYRVVRPDFAPFAADLTEMDDSGLDRLSILASFRRYVDAKDVSADWETIERVSTDDLVLALAMMLPFDPREKQALLESANACARAVLLQALLDMAAREGTGSDGSMLQ